MSNNIAVLIHGPYAGNAYKEIFRSLKAIKDKISRIIISTYIADKADTEKALEEYKHIHNIKVVYNKDLINPGYFNLNRQIFTVKNGLDAIDDKNCLVIKLRNDQWFNPKKLLRVLSKALHTGGGV